MPYTTRRTLRLILVLFIWSAIGCASAGNPRLQQEGLLSKITIGETTKADVLSLLGKPNGTHIQDQFGHKLEIWSYAYSNFETNP